MEITGDSSRVLTGTSTTVLQGDFADAFVVTNYALPHLYAAARFSRRVGEIEQANQGQPFGDFWEEIRHNSAACVVLAVAAVESYANELLFELKPKLDPIPEPLKKETLRRVDRKPVEVKLSLALALLDKTPFKWGEGVGEALLDVTELRNAIVHYKPEPSNALVQHAALSARLMGRFIPSTFFPPGEGIFPRRWCCHSCTKWVVETCLDFGTEFELLSGLQRKFGGLAGRAEVIA